MIDEAWVNNFKENISQEGYQVLTLYPPLGMEALNLMALGIWARDVGIPALKEYSGVPSPNIKGPTMYSAADEALSRLPKQNV